MLISNLINFKFLFSTQAKLNQAWNFLFASVNNNQLYFNVLIVKR